MSSRSTTEKMVLLAIIDHRSGASPADPREAQRLRLQATPSPRLTVDLARFSAMDHGVAGPLGALPASC